MRAELYIVKEAGAADAAMRYAGVGLGKLRDVTRSAFSSHPLPSYLKRVQITPGPVGNLIGRLKGLAPYDGPPQFVTRKAMGYGPGVVNKLKTVGHAVGDFAREGLLGSPVTVGKELREKGLKRFYRDSLLGSPDMALLSGALTALDVGHAITAPKEHRGEAIGRAVGGAAMAPLTGRLGVPGQLLLHAPVTRLTGRIGRLFDPKPQPPPTAPLPDGP